jgi:hypothetical protein
MPKMLIRNPLQIQEILQQRAEIHFSAHKDLHKSKNPSGCGHEWHALPHSMSSALPAACPLCRTARTARATMPTKRFSRAHYFAHGAFVQWFSFGHNADRDVSVRDGTHQTVVLPNRSNSTIVIPHRRGRSWDRVFRADSEPPLLIVSPTCIVILLFVVASLQPLGGGGIRVRRFSGSHAPLPMEPE